MELLVSCATALDALAAIDGGADIVDAKDPAAGALGAVTFDVFRAIAAAVDERRPLTAAMGDATTPASVETDARMFASLGAALIKLGFAGIDSAAAVHALAEAAVRGARSGRAGVVLVAYADRAHESVSFTALLDVASSAGAAGVLLDTADKRGPRLTELLPPATLAAWVERAHRRSLTVALAGRLLAADLPIARQCGADVAGVRGAACAGGRGGVVEVARVRALLDACTDQNQGRRRVRENPAAQWLRADAGSSTRQPPSG
jgi:uncharacterized protein (UPF0264 family)